MIVEKHADQQPAPRDGDRAAALERDVVRRQAAGEDRDDRERDREVLEPAHRAEELLRVAEPVQHLLVLGDVGAARSRWFAAHARLPLGTPESPPKPVSGLVGALHTTLARRRARPLSPRRTGGRAAVSAVNRPPGLPGVTVISPPALRASRRASASPRPAPSARPGRGRAARARLEDRSPARPRDAGAVVVDVDARRRAVARRARRRPPSGRSGRRCRASGWIMRSSSSLVDARRGPAPAGTASRSSTPAPVLAHVADARLDRVARVAGRPSRRPASCRAAATSVSTVRVIWSTLRSIASSAARYSLGRALAAQRQLGLGARCARAACAARARARP